MLLCLSLAAAAPLSLEQALQAALLHNPTLLDDDAGARDVDTTVRTARAAFDPTLSLGGDVSGAQTQSYLGGYPTASTTQAWGADAALSGALETGTTWSVSANLDTQSARTESSLGGVTSTADTDSWAASLGVSARQDLLALLRPTTSRIALRQAVEAQDQAAIRRFDSREQVLAEVAGAWWDWTAAAALAEVDARALADAQALEKTTQAWVEEGQTQAVELARVRADRMAAEATLQTAQDAVQSAADTLLLKIGGVPGAPIEPAAEPELQRPARTLDDHLADAAAHSPTLLLAQLEREAAENAAHDVRFSALPELGLSVAAGLGTFEDNVADAVRNLATDGALPSWSAGLDLTLPLGGRAARAERDRAAIAVERADLSYATAARQLDADVRAAVRSMTTAEAQATLARARLAVAQETEAGERARVQEGTRRLDQLLDAVHTREDAESDVIDADRALSRAAVTLARAEGAVATLLVR